MPNPSKPESVRYRANYATVYLGVQLGPERHGLDLEWATASGDETDTFEFEVPTDETREAYIGLQAFDVSEYGHEIVVNGDPLSGFDIPPNDGWQYWIDTLSGAELHAGTNTLQIQRDTDSEDAFAVGTVTVHWKEPVDE